ncbi:PPC domain-containing protein [Streptomyces sp. NPDC017673]|uniref:PPC domain-containing protein n=1 Tax=unclassified Streptomyces TaxID=2593676 RepID=UPI0037B25214
MRKTLVSSAIGVVMVGATLTPAAAADPTAHTPSALRTGEPQQRRLATAPTGTETVRRCQDASALRTTPTDGKRGRAARITGTLPSTVRFVSLPAGAEDDGSLVKATDTGIGTGRSGIRVTGTVGDGPHAGKGDGTGDFDFYRLRARAGQTITAKITGGSVDAALTLYDASGQVLAGADDSAGTLAPTLISKAAGTGTYYLMVAGSGTRPQDPSDSGSGNGVSSEGTYTLSLSAAVPHTQYHAVRLRAGDVVGAAVDGSPDKVAIYGPDGTEDEGSTGDVAHNHPASSPLPSGRISLDDVAAEDGWYCVAVSGDTRGPYRLRLLATRPRLEGTGDEQTIFLDFDGARIDPSVFASSGLPVTPGLRTTSPLSAFLGAWGLPASAEKPLADAITADVRRRLGTDLASSGINKRFGVRVLSSEHDADPGDAKNVDRVVIGGTIEETDLPTLGVTSSIDPGDFDTSDTSIVLLDLLSGPAGDTISLNHYMKPTSDRITFISTVVSNLVSHEIGHALGNWHTATDGTSTLMDNDSTFLGTGPDGVGGTADDDVPQSFGTDAFTDADGLTGVEDTAVRTAYALSR